MTISALQLGSELIRRSAARGRPLTNLSLQKLAYFAHGWHLALLGQPLVDSPFEAWRYGPVLPEAYHAFKAFSSNAIPADHPLVTSQARLDDTDLSAKLIDRALEIYGQFSSFELVDLSHDDTGPWARVYNDPFGASEISDDDIRAYFERFRNRKEE